MKYKFITFEGSEGSGKSTQIELLKKHFEDKGQKVLVLREPGGTVISEKIREILLDKKNNEMASQTEIFLYMSARAQLVEQVIKPALAEGKVVLSDRFLDSSFVYQGYGLGLDLDLIATLGKFATQGLSPDRTFILDLDTSKGFKRIENREKDRIELRDMDYHNRVRCGYQELAEKYSDRIRLLDVTGLGIDDVHQKILSELE